MTAGRIKKEWLDAALVDAAGWAESPLQVVEEWFREVLSAREVSIDYDGYVWVLRGQSPVWANRAGRGVFLSQNMIDNCCERIDHGI